MNSLLQLLSGKKTYLTVAVIGVLLFGSWQHWWTIPAEFYAGLAALALAFLRSGVAKAGAQSQAVTVKHAQRVTGFFLAISLGISAAGCKHTPQAEAYLTLEHTKTSVLEAMNVYAVAVAADQVNAETQTKIDGAYDTFRTAFQAAVEVARFNYQDASPENVRRLALDLVALIDDL
jgi:hypothetical protein